VDEPVAYSTQAISNSRQQIALLVIGSANRFFDFACSGLQVMEVRQFQHPDSSDCDPRPHPGCPVCTSNAAFGLYVFIINSNDKRLIILKNNQGICVSILV
jgi:hypothetical protein